VIDVVRRELHGLVAVEERGLEAGEEAVGDGVIKRAADGAHAAHDAALR